jgi:hypothetical protein
MPGSIVAAGTTRRLDETSAPVADARAPAVEAGAAATATGRPAGSAVSVERTEGLLTQAATASLTRGKAQTTSSVPRNESMEMVAAAAIRLWG